MDTIMKQQATRDLLAAQLALYPDAPRIRVEITWGPNGVVNVMGTPLPEGETPTEAPTFQGTKYKAWGQYSIENDRSLYLVRRGY
jgi:hypothetical protein